MIRQFGHSIGRAVGGRGCFGKVNMKMFSLVVIGVICLLYLVAMDSSVLAVGEVREGRATARHTRVQEVTAPTILAASPSVDDATHEVVDTVADESQGQEEPIHVDIINAGVPDVVIESQPEVIVMHHTEQEAETVTGESEGKYEGVPYSEPDVVVKAHVFEEADKSELQQGERESVSDVPAEEPASKPLTQEEDTETTTPSVVDTTTGGEEADAKEGQGGSAVLDLIISETFAHPFPVPVEDIKTTDWTTKTEYPFEITTFASNDIVSQYIRTYSMWDRAKTRSFQQLSANTGPMRCLDVGANLGWFALLSASLGHKVVAFEPFAQNIALFNNSVTLNHFEDRIAVIPFGLSNRELTCRCISESANVGDCFNICDGDGEEDWQEKVSKFSGPKYKYEERGRMQSYALDQYMPELKGQLDYMKIDVEGYELPAVQGAAETLFGEQKVPFIESEFAPKMMRIHDFDPLEYLKFFHDRGYTISHDGTVIDASDEAREAFTEKHATHILDINIEMVEVTKAWHQGEANKWHLEEGQR